MLNLQTIDSPLSTSSIYFNIPDNNSIFGMPPDYEIMEDNENSIEIKKQIEDQYINLNNLGIYLLNLIDNYTLKNEILEDLLIFVNENYTPIVNQNFFKGDITKIGSFTYQFFCIDCFTMILPNFIQQIKCDSPESFEQILQYKFKNNSLLFKKDFLNTIKKIVMELLKLEKIDNRIQSNTDFIDLKKRFAYYLDLIEFGDGNNFLYNYIIPVINNNFSEIWWRSH